MESKKGRIIHNLAEIAREKEQDFLKALKLLDEATLLYSQDKDYLGMSEAQGSRFIVLKHLYEQSDNRGFLILALLAAKGAVEIAEEFNVTKAFALAYFNLGKAYEEDEKYEKALDPLKKAYKYIQTDPPKTHDRPAVIADIKAHLGFIQHMTGDKTGLQKLEEGIKEIENSDEGSYTKDVWSSGGHMRIAKAIWNENREKAKNHLQKAEDIINQNPELTLRKGQLDKLKIKLNV